MNNLDPDIEQELIDLHLNHSTKRTARFLGVSQRAAQRWISPDDPAQMYPHHSEKIHAQAELVREMDLFNRLEGILSEAAEKGVHDQVIGGMLMSLYDRFVLDKDS